MNKEFFDYYNRGREFDRNERCVVEFARTKEIISRYISSRNSTILDMGGGAGYYSFWLSENNHNVDLRDPVPLHIEQANEYSKANGIVLKSADLGNSLKIDFDDDTFDYILLLGPLYHLRNHDDRITSLKEAKRVLKNNGKIFVSIIPRTASIIDYLYLESQNTNFEDVCIKSWKTGEFINNVELKFTDAYFYNIDDFKSDVESVGLCCEKIMNIEGPFKTVPNFNEKIEDRKFLEEYMKIAKTLEEEKSLFGIANHLMAVLSI